MGVEINGAFKAYPYSELSKNGQASFKDSFAIDILNIGWNEEAQSGTVSNIDGKTLPSVSSPFYIDYKLPLIVVFCMWLKTANQSSIWINIV